jgi:hypothetical protein
MKLLDQDSQSPGTASDVEDPKTWLNSRLVEERFSRRLATNQLHERIVERQ